MNRGDFENLTARAYERDAEAQYQLGLFYLYDGKIDGQRMVDGDRDGRVWMKSAALLKHKAAMQWLKEYPVNKSLMQRLQRRAASSAGGMGQKWMMGVLPLAGIVAGIVVSSVLAATVVLGLFGTNIDLSSIEAWLKVGAFVFGPYFTGVMLDEYHRHKNYRMFFGGN